jgi:hypothetical protein
VRPTPPPGPIGVSINGGDYATNHRHVQLDVVWPPYAGHALISNDRGFGSAGGTKTLALAPQIAWTLPSAGSSGRIAQTVYLRFPDSRNPSETFSDDIVLDTTSPVIESASISHSSKTRQTSTLRRARVFKVRLRAHEKISGIAQATFSTRRSGGKTVIFRPPRRRGIVQLNRVVSIQISQRPHWVRVRSTAGTWSHWHRIR